MIRRSLTRCLPPLVLCVVPLFVACKPLEAVVGDDSIGDSGATGDGGCTIYPACVAVSLPAGCTWGEVTCNSATKEFSCPEPVCPDAATAGGACNAAGGVCTGTGSVACANRAPESDQDCNPTLNPGGAFCCLDAPADAGEADGGCTIYPPCVAVSLPAGCTWGEVTCNSATKEFSCPEPVCPDAATAGGACNAAGGVCTGTGSVACANRAPESDQDCNPTLNPGGAFCCLDAPADAGEADGGCTIYPPCAAVSLPPGCTWGEVTCNPATKEYSCPEPVCADAGSEGGACVDIEPSSDEQSCQTTSDCLPAFAGKLCAGGCTCPNATINVSSQPAYQAAINALPAGRLCGCPAFFPPECVAGRCVLTGPGQGSDSGTPFACGGQGLTCNPALEYCEITEGGAISPDGGVPVRAACEAFPPQCATGSTLVAEVCGCLNGIAPGQCSTDGAGDITITLQVP